MQWSTFCESVHVVHTYKSAHPTAISSPPSVLVLHYTLSTQLSSIPWDTQASGKDMSCLPACFGKMFLPHSPLSPQHEATGVHVPVQVPKHCTFWPYLQSCQSRWAPSTSLTLPNFILRPQPRDWCQQFVAGVNFWKFNRLGEFSQMGLAKYTLGTWAISCLLLFHNQSSGHKILMAPFPISWIS